MFGIPILSRYFGLLTKQQKIDFNDISIYHWSIYFIMYVLNRVLTETQVYIVIFFYDFSLVNNGFGIWLMHIHKRV